MLAFNDRIVNERNWVDRSEGTFFAAKYFLSTRCFSFRVLVPRLAIRARVIFRGLACRALASVNLRLDCTVGAVILILKN